MRVHVELPPGWGPGQLIIAVWIAAGYAVDEVRHPATGERRLIVHGENVAPPAGAAAATKPAAPPRA
jgi:hypothetical protein